uniref:Retrotransposon gag domain-containing protein n=1 Tax=Cannabis sativa TaxID=3483 RepID=A0A803QHL9_CANSA
MANEQEDLVLHDDPKNTHETQMNTGNANRDASHPIPPWREILERLKQQEGKMKTQGAESALQKEHIQRLESENGQMKVVLEGYQRPLHAEETDNHQVGEAVEKENHANNNHPGNRIWDEVEEITEVEALRTAPQKRTTELMITGSRSMASRETEKLQEMMWNKLLALEAKSQMGIHSEWARMEGSTLSPFGNHILRTEAPPRYVAPKLPEYNGAGDPLEYVCQFEQKMLTVSVLLEDLEAIKCKTSTQGLRGPALRWFTTCCPEHGDKSANARIAAWLEVKKGNNSGTRPVPNKGPNHSAGVRGSGAVRPHNRTENCSANERNTRGTVIASMGQTRQPNTQWSEEELPRMTITLTEMMRQLRGMKETKWPTKMNTDPDKRDKSRYCAFHGEHGHATYECRPLKIEVNRLAREGFFRDCLATDSTLHVQQGCDKRSTPPTIH